MQIDARLDRRNLSEDLAAVVRQMIFEGRLPAGQRINEVHLAAQLGVSRTPLREALAGLVAEAALFNVPRQGFFVRGLTLEEARNIYPIRAFLDPEALRLSGIPSPARLGQLEAINKRLRKAGDVAVAVRLDEDWHRTLWAECPNPVLVELIEQFMRRTRRYELASMGQQRILRSTTRNKARIVETLREGRLARACTMLRKSLLGGGTPVFEWLTQRDSDNARNEESSA
jgi:DNA-binding GntR family transcriptional regulator